MNVKYGQIVGQFQNSMLQRVACSLNHPPPRRDALDKTLSAPRLVMLLVVLLVDLMRGAPEVGWETGRGSDCSDHG